MFFLVILSTLKNPYSNNDSDLCISHKREAILNSDFILLVTIFKPGLDTIYFFTRQIKRAVQGFVLKYTFVLFFF